MNAGSIHTGMQIGGQTNGAVTDEVCHLAQTAHLSAFKLFWHHSLSDLRALREAGCTYFCVRLRDMLEMPPAEEGDSRPLEVRWACQTVDDIQMWYRAGVRDFQWGNEPNDAGKFGAAGAWNWRYYMIRAYPFVRNCIEKDVRLGLCPLSSAVGAGAERWKTVMATPLDPHEQAESWAQKQDGTPYTGSPLEWHDAICVNSYWQWPQQVTRSDMGGAAALYHTWGDGKKPVWVTEWGTSACDLQPPPTEDVIEAHMIEQYPVWLDWAASQRYIEQSYVFMLPGSGWEGFWVTSRAAEAMSAGGRGPAIQSRRVGSSGRFAF